MLFVSFNSIEIFITLAVKLISGFTMSVVFAFSTVVVLVIVLFSYITSSSVYVALIVVLPVVFGI